jgi:dolichol-phosphate mannosyltransferase
MASKTKIFLLAPAYNEQDSLVGLLNRTEQFFQKGLYDLEFVLVNDGSKDNTKNIFLDYNASFKKTLVDVPVNKGLANAFREGYAHVNNVICPGDVLVTMDADDSHNPFQVEGMLKFMDNGYNFVIASRFRQQAIIKGLSSFRKLTGFMAGSIFRIFIGLDNVRDYTCGFRAIEASLFLRAYAHHQSNLIEEQGFSCAPEFLLKLSKFDMIAAEVPLVLRYDRKLGASKMKVAKTIMDTLKIIVKYHTKYK